MSQTPEPPTPSTPASPPKPDLLYQVAAWVAIVAGILVIVITVLFFVCMFWWCH